MRRLNFTRRFKVLRLILFLGSLLVCLWWGQASLHGKGAIGSAATVTDAKQLTQQGWELYQNGDVQAAIARWQMALSLTADHPSDLKATVLKHLVRADQQIGAMDDAIAHLTQLIAYYRQTGNPLQVGRMMTEQAQVYTSLGQQRRAIALLCGEIDQPCGAESAITIARTHADPSGEMAAFGSLGNAYRLRGDYDRALQYLTFTLKLAEQTQRPSYTLAALHGLGNTYISLAQRDDRRRQSAEQSDDEVEAQSLAQRVGQHSRNAIRYFEASVQVARAQNDTPNELRSLLNLVVPLQRLQVWAIEDQGQDRGDRSQRSDVLSPSSSSFTPISTLQRAQTLWDSVAPSREKAYAAIRIATLIQLVSGQTVLDLATHCLETAVPLQAIAWLKQAGAIAQQIRDPQSEAFALGRLGHVYECRQEYEQALTLTQQAQLVAANYDSRYLWEWQSGRILQAQHKIPAAIAAYNLAVKTLQTIRGDLAIASRDFQFDFRDTIEPVYRELTALYLDQATREKHAQRPLEGGEPDGKSKGASTAAQALVTPIELALETIDKLRLAELQNYLGEDCTLNTIAKPVTVIDPNTAVLSSVILGDRVAVMLTLPAPNQQFRSVVRWLPDNAQTVTTTINDLRRRLEKRSDLINTYEKPSQQVYDWLIRPFAQDLQSAHIETLVFIQDGILRSIPMAALYDGKQFLVEQYAIASTLSLTLIDPLPLDRPSLRVLGFGLTQPAVVDGSTFFAPLSYVKAEIDSIEAAIPGSRGLLDSAFTLDRVRQELTQKTYPIVHLATHGRFGIDARDTFLVTGKKERGEERGVRSGEWGVGSGELREEKEKTEASQPSAATPLYNEKLTMNALYQMLRSVGQERALELLTLTACETAVGSDRDALGIAGISLQAGARSAVASLWQVDDAATAQLITHFYQALKQGMSRAKALQTAQKTWLQQHPDDRHHPGYWAALILVGNWL
ncbi:MAG: CHAT domain-containing protein [Lyngbya sp. HA4199-MV5]|jgi:CHAT domain-containing protein|nr:CHAT domain-containing protein [Lyngbya sp. HA4199-MV5]